MIMSNSETVQAFIDGAEKGGSGNIWADGDVLYSYRHHFPLMVRTSIGYVLNADKYSVSTSAHQSECFAFADHIFPFSAFINVIDAYGESARVVEKAWEHVRVVDREVERWDVVGYHHLNEETHKREYISVAEYNSLPPEKQTGCYKSLKRRPAATVLNIQVDRRPTATVLEIGGGDGEGDGTFWLASMDGHGQHEHFYLCELPFKVRTVPEAFEALKPEACKGMTEGADYERQGEWFFVDITEYVSADTKAARKKEYDGLTSEFVLPREDRNSNPHTATKGGFLMDLNLKDMPDLKGIDAKTPVVCGQVRHPQHAMARLGTLKDIRFWACFVNTAKRSYSASGGVD